MKPFQNGDNLHVLHKDSFAFGPPHYKLYFIPPFCINTHKVHMFYIVHKWDKLNQITIHIDTHEHPILGMRCREAIE